MKFFLFNVTLGGHVDKTLKLRLSVMTPSGNTSPLITHLSCPDIMHIIHRGHNSVVEHNVFTPCGTLCLKLVVFNDIASFRKICGGLEKGRLFVFVL